MSNQCKQCNARFEVTDSDRAFYSKIDVPEPKLCFSCTMRRLLCFRNGRTLYQRKCDATGVPMISIISPQSPYKVYKSDYWYSDAWDARQYGRDFDFSRSFFEQFAELQREVPRLGISNIKAVNSDYCNSSYGNTNCYMIFGGDNNVDCMYGALGMRNRDTIDVDSSNDNELCYELGNTFNSYNVRYGFDVNNCNDCAFINNCAGSSELIFCTNLKNKSFCIDNAQLSEDIYKVQKAQLLNGSAAQYAKHCKHFAELLKTRIVKYSHQFSCEDCTGDYLKSCKLCINCYDAAGSENLKDVIFASLCKDCRLSAMLGDRSELIYSTISTFGAYNTKYSFFVIESSDVEYCDFIMGSKNIFGSVCMRKAEYCILNKQYTPDEFKTLRAKIIAHMKETGEWGQFLPATLSLFGYNETTAHEYFPCSRDEALSQGFKWQDQMPGTYGKETMKPEQIPDNIGEMPSSITREILVCQECSKNYKITEPEFAFYKRMVLPIPRSCQDCRYRARLAMRNSHMLWHRQCMCDLKGHDHDHGMPGHSTGSACGRKFETTYAPDRPEKVFCEQCYQKEVV